MSGPRGRPGTIWTTLAASILVLGTISLLGSVPAVHATSYTLDSSTCATLTGSASNWSPVPSTCTIPGSVTLSPGDSLDIPYPTDLFVASTGSLTISSGASVTIDSGYHNGINMGGGSSTVSNQGTITMSCSSYCINFAGYFTNTGIINVDNGGSLSIGLRSYLTGSFVNSGIINIANSGGEGIDAYPGNPFTNSGTIYVDNTGGVGINVESPGTLTNTGSIILECSGNTSGTISGNPVIQGQCTSPVPEFPLGMAFLFAVLVPAILAVRKRMPSLRIPKV